MEPGLNIIPFMTKYHEVGGFNTTHPQTWLDPAEKWLHDCRHEKKQHAKLYLLAISVRDERELLYCYEWIKRGREQWRGHRF